MALTKLGLYIEPVDNRNTDNLLGADAVVGLSTQKHIIHTKADLDGVSLVSYKLFFPGTFAYVPDTSRRGDKVSLAYNESDEIYLVSSISIVFKVSNPAVLFPDYLFMYFNRPEFDRYARFHSLGSAREMFSWEDMCDINIDIPPLSIQQKYVNVYNSMLANQCNYERGLADMKFVCEAFIDKLQKETILEPIGSYLIPSDKRNTIKLSSGFVRGLTVSKQMIPTKADMDGVSLNNYKIVPPKYIAYVPDTSRRGDKVSLGMNTTSETVLVSSISIVFTTNREKLLPEYLMLFFNRPEFDRYARFHSWGSARETFDWNEMCAMEIPIPDINVQRHIVNIYIAYQLRKEISEQLKAQMKDICQVLIKGSLGKENNC